MEDLKIHFLSMCFGFIPGLRFWFWMQTGFFDGYLGKVPKSHSELILGARPDIRGTYGHISVGSCFFHLVFLRRINSALFGFLAMESTVRISAGIIKGNFAGFTLSSKEAGVALKG